VNLGTNAGPLHALVEQSPEAMLVVSGGRAVFANSAARRLLGLATDAELAALEPWAWAAPATRETLAVRHARLLAGKTIDPMLGEDTLVSRNGNEIPVETVTTVGEVDGDPVVLVLGRELSLRAAARESLAVAHDRFGEAFRLAPTGMLLLDEAGAILDANAAAGRLAGLDPEQTVGRSSLHLLHPEDRSLVRTWLAGLMNGAVHSVSGERRVIRADGAVTWAHMSIALLPGNPESFVVHLIDITERRDTEARLAHQALHDPLTGLPNRALLFDRLAQAVRAALRGGPGVTVLYLDVDNFKVINDTRGHTVGDRVLRVVADRLARVLRPADTVARLGGDEFAIVAEGLPTDAAQELAERIADAINAPVPMTPGESPLPISTSIGVAHSAEVPLDVDALLNAADAAMYRAKQHRRDFRDRS
jgi:diguanylate cyclase (GGDEF)-like protein/PAS domain S-box-containing protein